ncbi:hypothetical protein ACSBR2_023335 [Camellia fascicularis]
MIREMKAIGNDVTDEQKFWLVIRSLPHLLWGHVKLVHMHNEGIKTFDDISRHLKFKIEHKDTNHTATLVAKVGNRKGYKLQCK